MAEHNGATFYLAGIVTGLMGMSLLRNWRAGPCCNGNCPRCCTLWLSNEVLCVTGIRQNNVPQFVEQKHSCNCFPPETIRFPSFKE